MPIAFSNNNIRFSLKNKTLVKNWVESVIKKEKKLPGKIQFVFTNDESLLEINKSFLNHNTLTDIITFDYCEEKKVNGEIYISVERVKENAKKFNVDFENEILRVIIHGVLHLCGYKDKSKSDAEFMRKKENAALKLFKPAKSI